MGQSTVTCKRVVNPCKRRENHGGCCVGGSHVVFLRLQNSLSIRDRLFKRKDSP